MRPPPPPWLLGVLVCVIPLLTIANYFAYHAPGAIGSSLQSYFSLNEEDLASLFTIYSAPNILLVLIGGILIDRFGLILTSLAFNTFIFCGMILFACAPKAEERSSVTMAYLLIGRFLLGIGGECIVVCATAMVARWFKHSNYLTFALGFHSALVQALGSAPCFVLLPYLLGEEGMHRHTVDTSSDPSSGLTSQQADVGNVRLCLWIVVVVCAISLIANGIYSVLEARYGCIYIATELEEEFAREMDRDMMRLEMQQQQRSDESSSSSSSSKASGPSPHRTRSTKDGSSAYSIVQSHDITPIQVRETNGNTLPSNSSSISLSTSSSSNALDQHDDSTLTPQPLSPSSHNNGNSNSAEHSNLLNGLSNLRSAWIHSGMHHLQDQTWWKQGYETLKSLPLLFWLVILMNCLLSPILYSFSVFAPLFFMEKYSLNQEEAGFLTSILYISILLAPLFGYAIDRIGYRCIIQTFAAGGIPIMFLLFQFTSSLSPYYIMIGLGICYSITEANGLAMISDVIHERLLGTAYGILGCVTSIFLLFQPFLVGYIHMHTQHYYWSIVLFVVISLLGWFVSFTIYVYDVNNESLMSESTTRRKELEQQIEMGGVHSEVHTAYPELEIVFENDEENENGTDEEELFALESDVGLDVLP